MTIVNDDSRVINKLEASLTDDTRVVIYDRHMFIVQATGLKLLKIFVEKKLKCLFSTFSKKVLSQIFIFMHDVDKKDYLHYWPVPML